MKPPYSTRPRHIIVARKRFIVDIWIVYGDGSVWFKAHQPRTRKEAYGWL